MSSPYLICPEHAQTSNPEITEASFQPILDKIYEEYVERSEQYWTNGNRALAYNILHEILRRNPYPQTVPVCKIRDTSTPERRIVTQGEYKDWTTTAQQYRTRNKGRYICETHHKEAEICFTYPAFQRRINQAATTSRYKMVTFRPTRVRTNDPYRYSWSPTLWVIRRPLPKLLHSVFEDAGRAPATL